ncbi:MAG: 4'-phosphopantetheinyl transferase superfamily protein [Syntrophales bacterium]|nr:4'-phosphopantetheinyl transferase superfamily protein [Syntrophales bacterium]MDD5641329.1 4'-phosphopantetheinyl transferase superfamily protein [Syntrophales bacterium]
MGKDSPGSAAGNPSHPGISQAVLYSPLREPAFLASLPGPMSKPQSSAPGFSSLQMKQDFLAALLQEHSLPARTQDLALVHSRWGKPHLLIDGAPGPPVSFSWSAGAWWAAVGTASSWIGLDAASPQEFTGAFPVHKVFSPEEWQAATSLTAGNREEAAALLWAVKEAVVKARGCGYHFFGPRQIGLEYAGFGEHGPCWRGYLEAPGPDPAPPGTQGVLPVASIRLDQVWLAVAWMQLAAPQSPAPEG